ENESDRRHAYLRERRLPSNPYAKEKPKSIKNIMEIVVDRFLYNGRKKRRKNERESRDRYGTFLQRGVTTDLQLAGEDG
ncbi:MAG: hypothetical protein U9N35_08590, partial [Euryarchaeota archaeon]|nr:hypothetical protein [Euryarchaeota archaeon]